jgi:Mn2+/Fe2+ NRAMP family transporter
MPHSKNVSKDSSSSWKTLLAALGPGLLMAGAAIGVSHMVQATRAGADFGWQLLGLVVLVHIMKYPFFEYGHRYASACGESLLHGYLRMGRWLLYLFVILNLVTAVISIAGVTLVTAILANYLFGLQFSLTQTSAGLLAFTLLLLAFGRYLWLDRSVKLIMALLFMATVAAFFMASGDGSSVAPDFAAPTPWTIAGMGFLIALMGWMPAPIELSVWQSLWIGAKERIRGERISRAGIWFDFHVGYGMTLLLAVLFLGLGAMVMHGTGVAYAETSAGFATQFIQLYTNKLGEWARLLVAIAAFTTMLSTTITVVDAYPRSLSVGWALALAGKRVSRDDQIIIEESPSTQNVNLHRAWMIAGCIIGVWIIGAFRAELVRLLDVATAIAFLAAPVFAWMNFRLVRSNYMPADRKPGLAMKLLSWTGLSFFTGFGVLYLWSRLGF